MSEKFLSKYFGSSNSSKVDHYLDRGGYSEAKKIYKDKIEPEKLIEKVKDAHLRGLGGAGFATGVKWSFIPKESPKPKYLMVNCDEAEPGTFKDKHNVLNVTATLPMQQDGSDRVRWASSPIVVSMECSHGPNTDNRVGKSLIHDMHVISQHMASIFQ